MPWQETDPVDERERFIDDHAHGLYSMTELCARYGVSRQTGYKWLARYDGDGRPALRERSHAPHHCPHRIADDVAELLCAARAAHPMGPGQAAGVARPPAPTRHLARREHRGRSARASGPRAPATTAPRRGAPGRGAADDRRPL